MDDVEEEKKDSEEGGGDTPEMEGVEEKKSKEGDGDSPETEGVKEEKMEECESPPDGSTEAKADDTVNSKDTLTKVENSETSTSTESKQIDVKQDT